MFIFLFVFCLYSLIVYCHFINLKVDVEGQLLYSKILRQLTLIPFYIIAIIYELYKYLKRIIKRSFIFLYNMIKRIMKRIDKLINLIEYNYSLLSYMLNQ